MIRKIFLIFIGLIVLLTESVSGFYNYENRFKIFSLNRNISKTNCVVSYDKTKQRRGKARSQKRRRKNEEISPKKETDSLKQGK